MLSAFAYYFRAVTRNRVREALADTSRTAGALLAIVIALALGGSLISAGRKFAVDLHVVLAIFVGLQLAAIWIGLALNRPLWKARLALSYRDAEIERLFQAPLGRVSLRLFKLLQMQWSVVATALAYAFLSAGARDADLIRLFIGWTCLINLLMLHSHLVGSMAGYFARRRLAWVNRVLAAVVVAVIAYLFWRAVVQSEAGAPGGVFSTAAFTSLLMPVELMLAPAYSTSWQGFLASCWIPLLVLAIHIVLFALLDPFAEQGAAEPDSAQPTRTLRIWRLATTGSRWRAVVWKNVVARTRGRPAITRYALIFVAALVVANIFAPEDYRVLTQFVTISAFAVFIVYAALIAPSTQTPGLRLDLPYADVLRAMPISARELVFGAIVGPFLVLYGAVLVAFGLWAALYNGIPGDPLSFTLMDKAKTALVLLPFMLSWTFMQIVIQNVLLLYFPMFLGSDMDGSGANQDFGARLVGFVARFGILALLALPAAGTAYVAFQVSSQTFGLGGYWCYMVAFDVGSAVLLAEALVLIRIAAPRYLSFDLAAVR